VTGGGSWRLGKTENFAVVWASIVNEEPNSRCMGNFGYELMLHGKKSIGDLDSGDAVQFEKQR
jgi:hypothetical protein